MTEAHRDWLAWHEPYADPDSHLSRRLATVRRHLRSAFDDCDDGRISVISMCAGQGHDLSGVLEDEEPELVILCHGGNDMLRKLRGDATERSLRAMIELIRERGAEVVMIGVPAPGLWLSTAEIYTTLADELAVPMEDDILPELLGDNRYKSDHIHPNSEGYARLARAVEDLLRHHGAL